MPESVTRVYRYGLLSPRDAAEHARALQLLGQAWLYADSLRRVYNRSSAARRAIGAAEVDAAHVRAWEEAKLGKEERDERAALTKAAYLTLDIQRNEEIRRERSGRGHLLDAGTYWLVEDSLLQAAKASHAQPLRGVPFDGTGRIGAAIQATQQFDLPNVIECSECEGGARRRCSHQTRFGTKRVQVEPCGGDRYVLTIYVGELSEGLAIRWPMTMKGHRPLPPGGRLKQIAVQRIRRGHRYAWEALFTVTHSLPARDQNAAGVVGIDVGWRLEAEDQLRVATHDGARPAAAAPLPPPSPLPPHASPNTRPHRKWTPELGRRAAEQKRGALFLDVVQALRYCSAVDGFRDDAFNAGKAFAQDAGFLGAEHAKQWRNKDRLHRLAHLERAMRLPAGGQVALAWWQQRDRHLEDISAGVRGKALRRRKEVFAAYADALAKRYQFAVLEDMPMTVWVGESETSNRERIRSAAAISELQLALMHRFGPDRIHWAPAADTTRTCAVCGTVRGTSVGPQPRWSCEECGTDHHQDENAAVVLRKLGERWMGEGNPPRARTRKAAVPKEKKREVKDEGVKAKARRKDARKAEANPAV